MDEFAQSREDDDLFADEFEPIPTPVAVVEEQPKPAQPKPAPRAAPHPNPQPSQSGHRKSSPPRNETGRGPRGQERSAGQEKRGGRGGGRGGTSNGGGLSASRFATPSESKSESTQSKVVSPTRAKKTSPPPPKQSTATAGPPKLVPASETYNTTSTKPADVAELASITSNTDTAEALAQSNTPPVPAQPQQPARTPAVRGDRSLTGGPSHKKLTEEELSAKLEKMAILNAAKSEKHRLSEADQAAFQHREKELKAKAMVEKKNERAMEMERARNRERKMKAQGGREWDSEKQDSDIVDRKGRSSEYVRGGHGGVIRNNGRGGLGGSKFATADNETSDTTRTGPSDRGGTLQIRGRANGNAGRGAGRGRGGKAVHPAVPTPEDFPSLPPPSKAVDSPTKNDTVEKEKNTLMSPTSEKPAGDWAEEMATPVEEKKMVV